MHTRTSVYRAVRPLVRDGLVVLRDTADRRVKEASLTAAGARKIEEALPHWQVAQDSFLADYGLDRWPELVTALTHAIATLEP